jgi:nucleoid-associated protein YgaU
MAIRRFTSRETKTLGKSKIRTRGTEVYRTTLPTKISPADDDSFIIAGEADRLDLLAERFYGASSLWFVIASVNDLTNGTMHIDPGTELRIPNRRRIVG